MVDPAAERSVTPTVDMFCGGRAAADTEAGSVVVGGDGGPDDDSGAAFLGCTLPTAEAVVSRGVVSGTLPVFVVDGPPDEGVALLGCTNGSGATSVIGGNTPELPAMTAG